MKWQRNSDGGYPWNSDDDGGCPRNSDSGWQRHQDGSWQRRQPEGGMQWNKGFWHMAAAPAGSSSRDSAKAR